MALKKTIIVSPPVNMCLEEAPLFTPHLIYNIPILKIKYLKSQFVSASGLVYGRSGLLKECYHHTMPSEMDERLNELSHYYRAAKNDAENLIVLDDEEQYLLIHHTWHRNYYHWMSETILRVWCVKRFTEKMVLLLPSKAALSDFALPSLAPFTFKKVFHIPVGKSLLVRNLCIPQLKPTIASYIPRALLDLNRIYINHFVNKNKKDIEIGERVYISRKHSRRRYVLNEDEVIKILKKYNFDIVYNEDYSFSQQVLLYSQVRYLVSIHGAGLTNMMFMPPNSTVFEFYKRQTNSTDHHSLIFWYMADALNHRYYQQVCEPANPNDDFFMADMIVDLDLLERNMQQMFIKSF